MAQTVGILPLLFRDFKKMHLDNDQEVGENRGKVTGVDSRQSGQRGGDSTVNVNLLPKSARRDNVDDNEVALLWQKVNNLELFIFGDSRGLILGILRQMRNIIVWLSLVTLAILSVVIYLIIVYTTSLP